MNCQPEIFNFLLAITVVAMNNAESAGLIGMVLRRSGDADTTAVYQRERYRHNKMG